MAEGTRISASETFQATRAAFYRNTQVSKDLLTGRTLEAYCRSHGKFWQAACTGLAVLARLTSWQARQAGFVIEIAAFSTERALRCAPFASLAGIVARLTRKGRGVGELRSEATFAVIVWLQSGVSTGKASMLILTRGASRVTANAFAI